jgi:hypothetical protein
MTLSYAAPARFAQSCAVTALRAARSLPLSLTLLLRRGALRAACAAQLRCAAGLCVIMVPPRGYPASLQLADVHWFCLSDEVADQ